MNKNTKRKNIGIDARMYSDAFTGIGRVNHEVIQRIVVAKPEWKFVLFMNDPQFDEYEFPENTTKVRVNAGYYTYAEQIKFIKILLSYDLDLMHFTNFNMPVLYPRPFVVTIHDLIITIFNKAKPSPWYYFGSQFYRAAYRMVMGTAALRSKQIIAVTENTKQDILEHYPSIKPEKITVAYNAVDNTFAPQTDAEHDRVRQKYNLPQRFLLYVGNWSQHKNVAGLVEAFAKLTKNEAYHDVHLVITGKSNPRYPEVLDTIKKLRLQGRVHTVGHVPFNDLVALYSGASAHVHASLYEGFGIMSLEAMACGTPTIVSNTSALPEVCGDAAEYFDPRDTKSIVKAIKNVLGDDNRAEELIQKGHRRVRDFSWDDCADTVLRVYENAEDEI